MCTSVHGEVLVCVFSVLGELVCVLVYMVRWCVY